MLTLFDPPFQSHSATSKEAARVIKPDANRLRAEVLATLKAAGPDGLTDEEMQERIPMQPSTQRPRRIELIERGKVIASGKTRPTRSGRAATVWVAVN